MFSKTALFTLAAAATAVSAATNGTVVTTTKVVDVYTTYCPEPTTFELGKKKYTVTEPTTLTITDCPCTIVEPCYTCEAQPTATLPHPPVKPTAATKPVVPVVTTGGPAEPTLVAGAEQVGVAAMAGLAALGLFL
ncbi:uncharacterized protein F5Z01DRAFT_669899 [Emericellopsis atlantica]|uniref:Clock-controlled protein 6 n=1 Tax=Emericellopsis atlantica TaxID=2614577 RepID=A0A9P7ZXH8_9HYPO|nr:uncharacterized protein F5Z01DRAFT_669899 [Emericellopsis atlantica]KAG9259172.1 hypothetical protein F5Z01DRAFT_669899 [Emericellopsis atlantica]